MKTFTQLLFASVVIAWICTGCAPSTVPEQSLPESVISLVGEMETSPASLEEPVFPGEFLTGGEPARVVPKVQTPEPKPVKVTPETPKPETPKVVTKKPAKNPYTNRTKPEKPLNLGCQNWTACPAIHQSEIRTKEARLTDKKELIQDPAITPKQRLRLKMELSKLQNDIDDMRARLREKCMDC